MSDGLAALVLDGDLRAALVAVRSLARAGRPVGVVAMRRQPQAPRWRPGTRGCVKSFPHHAKDESAYVPGLLDLLDRHPADEIGRAHV